MTLIRSARCRIGVTFPDKHTAVSLISQMNGMIFQAAARGGTDEPNLERFRPHRNGMAEDF